MLFMNVYEWLLMKNQRKEYNSIRQLLENNVKSVKKPLENTPDDNKKGLEETSKPLILSGGGERI